MLWQSLCTVDNDSSQIAFCNLYYNSLYAVQFYMCSFLITIRPRSLNFKINCSYLSMLLHINSVFLSLFIDTIEYSNLGRMNHSCLRLWLIMSPAFFLLCFHHCSGSASLCTLRQVKSISIGYILSTCAEYWMCSCDFRKCSFDCFLRKFSLLIFLCLQACIPLSLPWNG